MALVRSAGIRGFRGFVAELGGDAEEIAVRCGLPVDALDTGEMLVHDSAVALALEVAATELDCPDFGVRLGSRQDISLLGPLGVAVRHAATLADAVESVTSYLFAHAQGMRIQSVDDPQGTPGVVALRYDVGPGRPTAVQATGLVLSFIHRAGLELSGGPYGLRTVDLPHRPPALESYERHFGVPVRVNRPTALMRVASNLSTAPLPGRDDEMRRLAEAMLARQTRHPETEVVDLLRSSLASLLSQGTPTLARVATQLAVHPRTLQRSLENSGTTFGQVLDDLRRQTARHLLTSTTLPMGQVAREVGYAEAATFSRKARAWWGMSPLAVRKGVASS
ncbi:AraC family transcriptional regulator [Nocardioides yefusunii]|uniref:AraC family transcriptional regulator ligand-binding domain-containing protein n=1 Tax=Nocardioides yefusunii TaxID=2500546 RepID=A0ABW1QWB6_9ACTN|nr:AraC family transcriptional regulator [Nocardioides yefusunii]